MSRSSANFEFCSSDTTQYSPAKFIHEFVNFIFSDALLDTPPLTMNPSGLVMKESENKSFSSSFRGFILK